MKYSIDKDYEGDGAQESKYFDTLENNENFDCYTINNSSILQSVLDNSVVCKYCYNELSVFGFPEKTHLLGRVWNFGCSNDQCASRLIPSRPMTPKTERFLKKCALGLALCFLGRGYGKQTLCRAARVREGAWGR